MELKAQFTYESVRHDQDTDLHLVVSLTAPKSDWQAKRPPICVVPVLDISGSMQGAKLDYAKQSILKLIEHLSAEDYLGLVSFSSQARVDAKPVPMTSENKDALRAIVHKYHTEGSTNFSGGMLLGFQVANEMDLPESTICRVIMFTDGAPTHGVTDDAGLQTLIEKQGGRASMSAFGYGRDAKQTLLENLASKGKGNYAFVEDPDSALAAFGKELGGLLSTYAQDIVVEIAPHNGHQIVEVLSDADVEEEVTGEVEVKVPHVLSEETINLVLAMKMAQTKQPGPRQVNAVDVKLRYQVIDSDGKLVAKTGEAKGKIQFVKDGDQQKTPTKEVDEIVARAQLTRAQDAAEQAASRGDFVSAAAFFNDVQKGIADRGHVGVAAVAGHVNAMYLNAESYRHTEGNRRGLRRAMSRGAGTSRLSASDESVLRSNGYSVSNAQQDLMVQNFVAPDPAAPAPTPATPDDLAGVGVVVGAGIADLGAGMSWTGGGTVTSNSILMGPAPLTGPAPLGTGELQASPAPADKPKPKKLGKSRSKRW